jgi:hypothetical protein
MCPRKKKTATITHITDLAPLRCPVLDVLHGYMDVAMEPVGARSVA